MAGKAGDRVAKKKTPPHTWTLQKRDPGSGTMLRCRWYAGGIAESRWLVEGATAPTHEFISKRWGRGSFRVAFHAPDKTAAGTALHEFDDPALPVLDVYPNDPAVHPPPAAVELVGVGPRIQGPGGMSLAPVTDTMSIAQWEYFRQAARADQERQREHDRQAFEIQLARERQGFELQMALLRTNAAAQVEIARTAHAPPEGAPLPKAVLDLVGQLQAQVARVEALAAELEDDDEDEKGGIDPKLVKQIVEAAQEYGPTVWGLLKGVATKPSTAEAAA